MTLKPAYTETLQQPCGTLHSRHKTPLPTEPMEQVRATLRPASNKHGSLPAMEHTPTDFIVYLAAVVQCAPGNI